MFIFSPDLKVTIFFNDGDTRAMLNIKVFFLNGDPSFQAPTVWLE